MLNKEVSLQKIKLLIKRFNEQKNSYISSNYNEAKTRQDFINPFFKALGWDIDNEQGYAESYREVVYEDKIKVGNKTKSPDYSFKIGNGKRLFFLEAKKPSINLNEEVVAAYQIRRYGWSAKLSISLITNFKEFAIYDCTIKPNEKDKASVSRIKYFTYEKLEDEFDFLWETFSREQLLKGGLDKYIKSDTQKKGTSTVDKEFLESLNNWRRKLASNIATKNQELDEDAINFTVQQTLDRIIFLRIAEDRNIEIYERLKDPLKTSDYYKNLFSIFEQANSKYNSGLFDFKKDKYSKNLLIDDKIVKEIIEDLYYPKSPYEFSVLSVEILGSAYEQFLGKVIRLTESQNIKIDDKPEVRKAGGVYYTPEYIVDYIVKNTLGVLLENNTPAQASKIKIVDPACGSGSFLVGAYQYLLDWHKDFYTEKGKLNKGKKSDKLTPYGNLTTAEKKRILLNNIFGVDIDASAVEVTKLSLLLKCLEGETQSSIENQMTFLNDRVLPTLDENIKCGNSLVDHDYYDDKLDYDGDERKIKPFSWQRAFPEVFKQGGFDVVVGNPPYVRMQTINKLLTEYLKKTFESTKYGNYDLYVVFIENMLRLTAQKSFIGMIVPNKFFTTDYGIAIRKLLTDNLYVYQINDFTTNQVFTSGTNYTCLLFLNKNTNKNLLYQKIELGDSIEEKLKKYKPIKLSADLIFKGKDKWNFQNREKSLLFKKLALNKVLLKDISEKIFKGSSTGNDDVYLLDLISRNSKHSVMYSRCLDENIKIENDLLKSFIYGSDVRKFYINQTKTFLLFPYTVNGVSELLDYKYLKTNYPLTLSYFEKVKNLLSKRKIEINRYNYYKFSAGRSLIEYNQKKILIPDMLVENRIGIDIEGDYFHGPAIHSLVLKTLYKNIDLKYIIALLSSKIFWFYIINTSTALRGNAYRLTPEYIKNFPIKTIDKNIKQEADNYNYLIYLVDQLLLFNKEKNDAKLQSKIEIIQGKIDYCEEKLNKIVYEFYELTEDEIKIIEGSIGSGRSD